MSFFDLTGSLQAFVSACFASRSTDSVEKNQHGCYSSSKPHDLVVFILSNVYPLQQIIADHFLSDPIEVSDPGWSINYSKIYTWNISELHH